MLAVAGAVDVQADGVHGEAVADGLAGSKLAGEDHVLAVFDEALGWKRAVRPPVPLLLTEGEAEQAPGRLRGIPGRGNPG